MKAKHFRTGLNSRLLGRWAQKTFMDNYPMRIAQVIGKLSAGGVESVVYNYYRHMDHTRFQFDFFIDADSACLPRQELIDMGARYFVVPPYQKLPQHITALIRLFRENRYQIVHSHMNTLAVFSLFAAWAAGAPVRICHNHSTAGRGEIAKNVMKYLLRPFAKVFATDYCSCSRYAGEWLFGRRAMERGAVTVFHNAVELDRFRFRPEVRSAVRKELNLEDQFVVGHVGRFCFQKNHEFLIDIFAEVYKRRKDAVLLLVGDGPLMESAREKARRMGLDGAVRFLSVRDDVDRLYQAMDVFVLPSRYEGLPVVGVEAQAAGLPCVVSDCVTGEARVTENVQFLPLDAGAKRWAEEIEKSLVPARESAVSIVEKHGFNITLAASELQRFYCSKLGGREMC